jgi:ornithine cyclodeaminase/alanine dehydrogenase-like protein (mu-crystallin family)
MIPFISGEEIRKKLPMAKAIGLMEDAFRAITNGDAIIPQRINMPLAAGDASLIMPVYVKNSDFYAVKTVSINKENAKLGKPLIHALVTLFSASSGEPLALMDGETITALRTGAASGLATSYLAEANAQRLAVFGTGVQAEYQIEAICEVRDIKQIDVFGRDKGKTQIFADKITARHAPCQLGERKDLSEADIICLATTSTSPLFEPLELKANCHINGVGSYRADMAELHPQYLQNATIVVDEINAALSEAGDITQAIDQGFISQSKIDTELGLLVMNAAKRKSEGLSFFKSVGNAAQDFFVAKYIAQSRTLF